MFWHEGREKMLGCHHVNNKAQTVITWIMEYRLDFSSNTGKVPIKASCLFLRIPNSPYFSPLSLPPPPPRLPTQAARWGGAAHEFFLHSSARQERRGKTYPLVYLRRTEGQIRTGQAFASSRQTLTNHVCPWLRPRIKKCVWPDYSRAENGKITGWSQENNPGC